MNGAIETVYKGYRFRSRLEARWAVFFDAAGVQWQYETQGYEVDGHKYLPDFWLPEVRDWVEVKGDPDGLRKDFHRMRAILGRNSPLPGFADGSTGLIVLGDIPDPNEGTILHPFLSRKDETIAQRTWGLFLPLKGQGSTFAADRTPSWIYQLFGKQASGGGLEDPASSAWNVEAWPVQGIGRFQRIHDAYLMARRARFEHGESGGLAA